MGLLERESSHECTRPLTGGAGGGKHGKAESSVVQALAAPLVKCGWRILVAAACDDGLRKAGAIHGVPREFNALGCGASALSRIRKFLPRLSAVQAERIPRNCECSSICAAHSPSGMSVQALGLRELGLGWIEAVAVDVEGSAWSLPS